MRPSNRGRGLRELNPDLLFGRKRRAPVTLRGTLAFLRSMVQRLGEDRRTCCDELRAKVARATADGIRATKEVAKYWSDKARAAEKERDDARKLAARWEVQAQDLRDLAMQEKQRADAQGREVHRLANEVQALSLRLEQARHQRAVFVQAIIDARHIVSTVCLPIAARPAEWSERRKRGEVAAAVYDIGLVTDRAAAIIEKGEALDLDPRQGKPGPGADLLPCAHAWTAHGYCAHCGADRAKYAVPPPPPAAPKPDTRWAAGHAPDFSPPAAPEPDPALTVADLRRADGPGPVDVAEALEDLRGLEGGLNSDCVIVEKGERFIVERPAARGNYKVSRPSGATIGFVAPTGKVRRVGNWETYEETAPAAPVVVPDMRGPRGREVPGAEIAQVFFGHSGDMVDVEHVCAKCGRAIKGPMRADKDGWIHLDGCPNA